MATMTAALTDQQSADYQKEGYLIIRDVLSSGEADDLRRTVVEYTPHMGYPSTLTYPEPGKYTISGNRISAPGLAPIAEHPVVVDAVEALLGQPAHLTAYVAYLRSPRGQRGRRTLRLQTLATGRLVDELAVCDHPADGFQPRIRSASRVAWIAPAVGMGYHWSDMGCYAARRKAAPRFHRF